MSAGTGVVTAADVDAASAEIHVDTGGRRVIEASVDMSRGRFERRRWWSMGTSVDTKAKRQTGQYRGASSGEGSGVEAASDL